MSPPEPPPIEPGPSVLAQSRMRDARLFLGLACIPGLFAVFEKCVSLLRGAGSAPSPDPSWEVATLMALSAWTTLLAAAAWKLATARHAGFDR